MFGTILEAASIGYNLQAWLYFCFMPLCEYNCENDIFKFLFILKPLKNVPLV